MPKVDALTVAGLELWFNSNDHRPPHFHAEKPGEWEVRIKFLKDPEEMVEVIYSAKRNRPNRSDLKDLTGLAVENRIALLEE